jgi:type IV secretion system protein VirB10
MPNNDEIKASGDTPEPERPGVEQPAPESPLTDSISASPSDSSKARGSFDIRNKRRGNDPAKKKLYLGIAAAALVFLAIIIGGWSLVISKMNEGSSKVDESTVKKDAALDVDKGHDDSMRKARAEQLRLQIEKEKREQAEKDRIERERDKGQPTNSARPGNSASTPSTASTGQNAPPVLTPAQRKMGMALMVTPVVQDVSTYGAGGSQKSDEKPHSLVADAQAQESGSGDRGEGSSRTRGSLSNLGGTSFAPAKAYLAPAGTYLVKHSTYTRCALYTEIVTGHPGIIECRLTDPLYSSDGHTVIANAGDRLTGEQSVEMGQGQVSVFTTWNELETQSGVRARLDSLGAGPMGASGTDAWIDHHYMQRFGGAVMLSIIKDTLQAAANATQKSGSGSGGYTVNNSEENVESMASKTLDSTINIPDTGYILPGTVITVIVARDIDFSSVFENR